MLYFLSYIIKFVHGLPVYPVILPLLILFLLFRRLSGRFSQFDGGRAAFKSNKLSCLQERTRA
jgi:hypothetical protein